ncbi:MAG TPA: SCO family protein [Chitinophagaceae bacterium]|nr:SCO family protein [Chitinophagaceae bacterium]
MNKTALYALILAVLLPLVSYFIIKQFSAGALDIPQPVFSDTTISKVVNGKIQNETIWHRLPDFTLTNQDGKQVSLHEMVKIDPETGDTVPKIVVANFFFTHCATICPGMTMNIKKLQESIKKSEKVGDRTADFVQFLSFSVDPDRDSVVALKKWADRFQINPENWWLLTGDKKTIYDLSLKHMNLSVQDPQGVDTGFFHTDVIVLIDRDRVVRMPRDEFGNPRTYRAGEEKDLIKLSEDIVLLMLEKDKKRKSFFAGKLELLAVVFLLALVGLGIFLFVLRKTRGK